MTFPRLMVAGLRRTLLPVALVAPALLPAQQGTTRKGFDLFAVVDFAATGVRAPTATYRFYVTNAGPMDVQSRSLAGFSPASVNRAGTFTSQFPEITLFAAAAPGDRLANVGRVPTLSNVAGGGAALSFNYHRDQPGVTRIFAADGLLGFAHSGVRSSTAGCLNHAPSLPAGVPLMPNSDCPQTWGLNGWQGNRPIPQQAFLTQFTANPATFRFNPFEVPAALRDTSSFLGDRFQTYGTANDYSRERLPLFGNVIPGGSGNPREEGYPLGLEWKFDAFGMNDAPGVVFWEATITNRSADVYGAGIDYDSLIVGVLARHGRRLRTHAGFDVTRGAAFFNEVGNDDATQPGPCDNALPVPGNFASDAFFGDCREPVAFGSGSSAVVMLKSPIGDLRYKLFSDSASRFFSTTSPVRDDTITYNIGRMCGDDCIADRFLTSATAGFGVLASREALALNGDLPSSLSPLAYYMLFKPANGGSSDPSRRVDLQNPRAGGGFNFTTVPGWRYDNRPAGAPATGSDTLFIDTCNPAADPATTPIVSPRLRSQIGRCVGRWVDTLPDRTLNFTRGATWLGAGPFRLAAGQSTTLTLAIVTAPDSLTLENSVDRAISLYQGFFVAPTPIPQPRIVSVRTTGGSIRSTGVRVWFDNRAAAYVDPFILQLSERFRVDTTGNSQIARLNRLNRRILRPNIAGDTGLRISDTLRILAGRQLLGHLVYKSCQPGSGRYTRSTSPNLCTNDRITDSLGLDQGPAPYLRVTPLAPVDSQFTFSDGNVLAGMSYQYVVVAASRGARLTLVTDTAFTAGGGTSRRIVDTVLVAGRADLPALLSAPNVATVYVPASVQSGGAISRVRYLSETGAQTFDGDSLAYAGPFVTAADTIPDTLSYRVVFGDSLQLREYQTAGVLDSTIVAVYRSVPIGFAFTQPAGVTDPFGRLATPARRLADSLVFTRRGPGPIARSIVGTTTTGTNVVTTTNLGGGRTLVRTSLKNTGGVRVASDQVLSAPTTVVGPLPQGVLLQQRNGEDVPVIVGNDFRANAFGVSPRILGSADYADAIVDVQNRPVVIAYTTTGTPAYGGVQLIESFFTDPEGGRFAAAATQSAVPTIAWQNNLSRFIGTSWGEYFFEWLGGDWGPRAPFDLNRGVNQVQADLDASLAARAVGSQTQATAEVVTAINRSLGTALTADSLLTVRLPFRIVDNSRDRATGGREVIAAIRASDKFYAPGTLPPGGIGASAARWLLLGAGLDTARFTVPIDQWVPGEPLILLERVRVADTLPGGALRRENGEVAYRDTLLVVASRATLGCRNLVPAICNPLQGRGGTGYTPTQQGYRLVVRQGIPLTSDRDVRFQVTPFIQGERVRAVTRSQLDSVKVVPNPYLFYSSFEQQTGNEQRVMFTHLPPQGTIRIYTAAGQFVQQLTWTPTELNGNGDLYFNLLTREGTLMASGLYLFTVEATGPSGGAKRKQVGRFIIIR